MSGYVKEVNNQILCDEPKLELFIPLSYFDNNWARETTNNIYEIFAICNACHYTDADDDRNHATKSVMTLPLKIMTKPSMVTDEVVKFNGKEDKYKVFTYYKDDIVITHSDIIQNGNDNLAFMKLVVNGKLDIIPYELIPTALQMNKIYNGVSYKLPAFYEEALISQYYRSPSDVSKPARFEAAVSNDKPFYAVGIGQRETVANLSTFASITYEDMTAMVTRADNNANAGKKELISSLESAVLNVPATEDTEAHS